MNVISALAATVTAGSVVGAGVTTLVTRNSDRSERAMRTAQGVGLAAGIGGAIGTVGLAYATRPAGPFGTSVLNLAYTSPIIGIPSAGLMAIGAVLGGAAIGAALVAKYVD